MKCYLIVCSQRLRNPGSFAQGVSGDRYSGHAKGFPERGASDRHIRHRIRVGRVHVLFVFVGE